LGRRGVSQDILRLFECLRGIPYDCSILDINVNFLTKLSLFSIMVGGMFDRGRNIFKHSCSTVKDIVHTIVGYPKYGSSRTRLLIHLAKYL